jgi:lipoic acid synthetase
MGEEDHEIEQAMRDLHDAGCDILTITQYLRPSPLHHPIDRWVKPEEFVHWSELAEEIGFKGVMAGPLVRSSYRAGKLYASAMTKWGRPIPENLSHLREQFEAAVPARQEAASLVANGLRGEDMPATHVS